ncbi:DNA/RNA helicase domain-containing protein [Nocardia sp. NPDC060259]|uniref:DNA/RNA helicase domain-containing protein n=1 Tax=Nocardia sp. NPDC060259 TaxID=3347088 RepID=UPI0036681640
MQKLLSDILIDHGLRTSRRAEHRSWDVSLPLLARLLEEADLGKVDMLIEYPMPASSRRADVVLAGVDPQTGADVYVVVELKQWSQAALGWGSDQIVWSINSPGDKLHPIDQVRGYCKYLQNYVSILHDNPDAVHGIAYLHNATRESVSELFERTPDRLGRLFTDDDREQLISYLRDRLAPDPGAADRLLASSVDRRSSFLDFSAAELREQTDYALLDNQQLAYEAVWNRIERSRRANGKCVVLVTGGPGSGKSIVAMAALAELRRRGHSAAYATGSAALTKTLRRLSGLRGAPANQLFTYYRNLSGQPQNSLDVLICDEAHRIRRTSTFQYTPREQRNRRPQIDELMAVARVPVFFLDENQVVRPDEVGTVDLIRDHAARAGFPVFHVRLDGQFRCGGSAAYDEWVLNLVGLRPGGYPYPWKGKDFSITVASSPHQMESMLADRIAAGDTARMAAGICWPWSKPRKDGSLVADVTIDDWARPWNRSGDKITGESPPSSLWASDPRGFGQIGCIYTAQGFEYDWGGVILGPDIGLKDDYLVVVRENNKDGDLAGKTNSPVFDDDVDRLIRNTYRVLLTRAMRGVVIHAVDPAVQEFIEGLVNGSNSTGGGARFSSTGSA